MIISGSGQVAANHYPFGSGNNKTRMSTDLVFSHSGHNRHKIATRWIVNKELVRA